MFFPDPRNVSENVPCKDFVDMDLFLHCSLVPSVLIILALSFLQRRSKKTILDDKIYLLNGRFGIIIPLDFIATYKNRWTFGFAFGAIADKVMSLFFEEYLPEGLAPWQKAFVLLVGAIEVGLSFYPIFACLSTDNKIIGSVTGFLYCLIWFIVTMLYTVGCPYGDIIGQYEKIIIHWPSLLCLIFLLGRFVYMFFKSIQIFLGKDDISEEKSFLPVHQAEHVKRLLRRPVQIQKSLFERKVYTWDPCFKFPSRMIGTSVLCLLCLYIFVALEFNFFTQLLQLLQNWEEQLAQHDGLNVTVPWIQEFRKAFGGVWFFTTFLASSISVTYVFHILVCYRKHMKRLWLGDKSFLPIKLHKPSSAQCVAAIARYSGWQVAYIVWGYLIMHIVQALFGIAFVYGFVYPIMHGEGLALLKGYGLSILTIAIVIVVMTLQVQIAAHFFLQKKISPEDKQKPLALNNRKAFHNFNYFFFFYNVVLGIGACLQRLICSLILGSWLIARIDRTLLQRGYESADNGYNTWVGMIYVDHYHTNPVLVSFCNILLTSRAEKRLMISRSNESLTSITGYQIRESRQAKTRWLLSYTLLKNPRLIINRKLKKLDNLDMQNSLIRNRLIQASVMEAEARH